MRCGLLTVANTTTGIFQPIAQMRRGEYLKRLAWLATGLLVYPVSLIRTHWCLRIRLIRPTAAFRSMCSIRRPKTRHPKRRHQRPSILKVVPLPRILRNPQLHQKFRARNWRLTIQSPATPLWMAKSSRTFGTRCAER